MDTRLILEATAALVGDADITRGGLLV